MPLAMNRDVFIIGGAKTYQDFAYDIEKWIVTRVPETVADADTFIRRDFLDGFDVIKKKDLGDGLVVETLCRK